MSSPTGGPTCSSCRSAVTANGVRPYLEQKTINTNDDEDDNDDAAADDGENDDDDDTTHDNDDDEKNYDDDPRRANSQQKKQKHVGDKTVTLRRYDTRTKMGKRHKATRKSGMRKRVITPQFSISILIIVLASTSTIKWV